MLKVRPSKIIVVGIVLVIIILAVLIINPFGSSSQDAILPTTITQKIITTLNVEEVNGYKKDFQSCMPEKPFLGKVSAVNPRKNLMEEDMFIKKNPNITSTQKEFFKNIELLSSYTTCFEPEVDTCGRVFNIQLMANTVAGAIVKTKDTFSINEYVGARTESKGYCLGGTIIGEEIVETFGGGVSQFATTFFNAAFYSGLEIPSSKAHTIYFCRYPVGRESTINLSLDANGNEIKKATIHVSIKNNTEKDIVIWTSYTNNSITVNFYGEAKMLDIGESVSVSSGISYQLESRFEMDTLRYDDERLLNTPVHIRTRRNRTYANDQQEVLIVEDIFDTVYDSYSPCANKQN